MFRIAFGSYQEFTIGTGRRITMNALEIKIHMLKKGLTLTGIARELASEYDATFESLRTMLKNLFYYEKYNAKLAALVNKKYGIKIDRPRAPQTVREAVRRAA